ncbi:cytochrome c oxidase subunit 3 [Halovulum sp. GXIMD14793]
MAHEKNHDYHILPPSWLPFFGSVGAFVMLLGFVLAWGKNTPDAVKQPFVFFAGFLLVLYVMFQWWSAMVHEGETGDHTPVVRIGLRMGVMMFIISEVMFFAAWFWSFFKHAMYPMDAIDNTWPPPGIETFDPWHLPLINTLILLLSGCAATWAHHAIAHDNGRQGLKWGLVISVLLGIIFTIFQAYEYSHASFGLAGNIYGANFFMATGFHGFHVIIGTIFLAVCLFRALRGHFMPEQHVGFEAAAWYWHFVDVVWLFLFFAVYVWGG